MPIVISWRRSIWWRLAIPACGLALIGLLAILYVNYPYIYHKLMTAFVALPFSRPFIDWEFIPSAVTCWVQGIDVYVNNTCYAAVPDMGHPYSPLWLRLTFIQFADGLTNFFGLLFAVLFFLSLAILPPPRNAKFDFAIRLFSAISSATGFALERANVDIVMFLMIMLGVLACRSRLPVRLVGYAVIAVAGLLKFYPMVALILAIRERPAIFITIGVAAISALGGLMLAYHEEFVEMGHNLYFITELHFSNLAFGARDLLDGLGVIVSEVSIKLLHHDPTSAVANGRLVHDSLLFLLIVLTLAAATWFGHRCRLLSALGQLDAREADFLLVGAALISGCFFIIENVLYRGIFLLLALPGLLTLANRFASRLARLAFQGTCVAIVFVLWFPIVEACVHFAANVLGKPISRIYQLPGSLDRLDGLIPLAMWFCDQVVWWWIILVLVAVLGAFMLNSELWAALCRVPGRVVRVPRLSGGGRVQTKRLVDGGFWSELWRSHSRMLRRGNGGLRQPPPRANVAPS